ncbi:MAG: terminase family protein [Erythrobacter sp.]
MNDQYRWLADAPPSVSHQIANALSPQERSEFAFHWPFFARQTQLPPPGAWRIWLILAGRGFGKTRAGAEWVRAIAEADPNARIALVSASLAEARSVMVEGESGLIACCSLEHRPHFEPSLRRIRFPNGAQAHLYSAAEPELLRGPQHSHAWCDEVGKWPDVHERATRCWDNLLMGLRLGESPLVTVTTTPRRVPLITRLLDQEKSGEVAVTRGSTYDNSANLPAQFIAAIESEFAGSQKALQEIEGRILEDIEGALWNRSLLEQSRENDTQFANVRIVVAVDPPATANGDACGIIVAALGEDNIGRVLADRSIEGASPERWARQVADTAHDWAADKVVAEANQGGDMVASVLRAANAEMPIALVHARHGKVARAEPIAALYETGRIKHCGQFPQLEDQLCGIMVGGKYAGPGRSPDRADALVWAFTELMLNRVRRPSVKAI